MAWKWTWLPLPPHQLSALSSSRKHSPPPLPLLARSFPQQPQLGAQQGASARVGPGARGQNGPRDRGRAGGLALVGWSVTAKDGPTPAQPQTRPAAVGSVRAASTRKSCRRAASPSSLYTKSLTWADRSCQNPVADELCKGRDSSSLILFHPIFVDKLPLKLHESFLEERDKFGMMIFHNVCTLKDYLK